VELDPVDRITTDAVGEPGQRAFYLQARKDTDVVTVLVEKQQVELLSASILEILSRIGMETGEGPADDELDLEQPVEPLWRVGRLSIGYEEERDLILLELVEMVAEEEEDEEEEEEGGDDADDDEGNGHADGDGDDLDELDMAAEHVRLWATREQMLALSRHGAAVVARGRPTCQFCGNPIDPEGHRCPAMNGHRA
jgi:uncharacterized repeat protein (TIGR03847 family)